MDKKLKKIFADILEVSILEISDNTNPENIDNWDSLKQMGLIIAIEEEFKIQFDDDIIFELDSYSSIKSALENLIN